MSQTEIEEIEISLDAAKEIVRRGERALKLADNPDFKALILEGYFRDEASRLALLYSDPQLSDEQREHVHRDLVAIGGVKRYLSTLVQMGEMAKSDIAGAEEVLEEMRAEGEDE